MPSSHNKTSTSIMPNSSVVSDPRFADRISRDPRFRRVNKQSTKVTIDKRFSRLLLDKSEANDYTTTGNRVVDKYGRRIQKQTPGEDLRRFYKLEGEEEEEDYKKQKKEKKQDCDSGSDDDGDEEDKDQADTSPLQASSDDESSSSSSPSSEPEVIDGYQRARGGKIVESSDESSSDEDDETAGQDVLDENYDDAITTGPYGKSAAVPMGDETNRLAIINMDWDHVKSSDLFKLLEGFLPRAGVLKSVVVYPSDFGVERMAQEAVSGPPAEIFNVEGKSDALTAVNTIGGGGNGSEEEMFNVEKLRKYQLERLKYFYAVAECDSVATAKQLYEACDGAEFENSGCFMDLRYVPDDTVFSNKPRDTATSAPTVYQKQDFVTRALQHSNVKLTWDEDDDDRVKVTRRAFTKDELKDMDFKAYLASSSSEEEEEDEEDNDDDAAAGHRGVGTASSDSGSDEDDSSSRKKKRAARNKYQSLLSSIGKGSNNPFAKHSSLNENTLVNSDSDNDIDSDEDVQGDMEITFTPGLSEAASKALDRKREKEMLSKETVFETKVRQMKEKKKAKRNLSNAAVNGDDDALVSDEDRGFDDDVDHHLDDDDFFIGGLVATNNTNTSASTTSSNNTSRGRKEQQQENIKDGETENHPVPMSKAELELLMMPDNPSLHTRNHFDAKDVIKAEKSGKNKKKKKARGNKFDEEGVQDGFEIDTADSRFKAVFEEHEFALDPTNPRFKKTKSMQQILSERRDRASISGGDDNSTIVSGLPPSSTTSSSLPKASESDNLKLLVDSVKRKSTSALTRTANHQGKRSRKE